MAEAEWPTPVPAADGVAGREGATGAIESLIERIDRKLSEQINLILHHEEFKALEGSWRGLAHLVNHTESGERLQIRVLNLSKKEAAKSLKRFKGAAWDQGPLFKKIYGEGFDQPGGTPYGCLIGDFYFDHTAPDVELLQGMSQIAAAAHCPFLAAAAPGLLGMESWQQLGDPRDLTKIFAAAEYAPWRCFRDSEDSRYVGLTCPRFLARPAYGKSNPVAPFAFEEETGGADFDPFVWANAAYAMGANITRAFALYGWCVRIRGVEGGGRVEGLSNHPFPADGDVTAPRPTEATFTDHREAELEGLGLIPLSHLRRTDSAAFLGAPSLLRPGEYECSAATADARQLVQLPYLFACCRFAHYLRCQARDLASTFVGRESMERHLREWVNDYVTQQAGPSEATLARRPLAAAVVTLEAVEEGRGCYLARFYLRPWHQVGPSASVRLRLLAKLPGARGSEAGGEAGEHEPGHQPGR